VKIYDCYAAGSEWWNVIGRPLLPWGPRGDTESGGQGLVGACEGCRNTGLIARLIGTLASWCGSWLALSRLISPFVPPFLVALVRCEKHHPPALMRQALRFLKILYLNSGSSNPFVEKYG